MNIHDTYKILLYAALILFPIIQGQLNGEVTVSTSAYFSNTNGGSPDYCVGRRCTQLGYSIPPNAQTRWGDPAKSYRSGLGFDAIVNKTALFNRPFYLGSLTHFNYAVFNAASSTKLNLQFTAYSSSGTVIANQLFSFTFTVDETPNQYPCKYPSLPGDPCSDKISFPPGGFQQDKSFTVGSIDYTLQLLGFKETNSSTSLPVESFISDEEGSRVGYLFARITAACPAQCQGSGSLVIRNDQCACDCTSARPCTSPQIFNTDCSCGCPNTCNEGPGGTLMSNCTCACNACPSPKISNPNSCACSCPANYCNGGTMSDPSTCGCTCPSTITCPRGYVVGPQCNCICPLTDQTCSAQNPDKIEDPDNGICRCICDPSKPCSGNFVKDPNTCACTCSLTCPNGQQLLDNCTCGNCIGNYVKDPQGLCTVCPLSRESCASTPGYSFNNNSCSCVCDSLVCDVMEGLVVSSTEDCACRTCNNDPICCGNGRIDPGEDCDSNDPCCQNCKFSTSVCDDGDLCTINDRCDGQGTCISDAKCPAADLDECSSWSCQPSVGQCIAIAKSNGTQCGSNDLCQSRCMSGRCEFSAVTCPRDEDTSDCFAPQCDPEIGLCRNFPLEIGTGCSDGDRCTSDDTCQGNGTCMGVALICPSDPTNPCSENTCSQGICVASYGKDNTPCDADQDACTAGDMCKGGFCRPGIRTDCSSFATQCMAASCNSTSGSCQTFDMIDIFCDDFDNCTHNDTCIAGGKCLGDRDEEDPHCAEIGAGESSVSIAASTAAIVGVAGAAAAAGAVAGAIIFVKKVKASKIADPTTWNPELFSSVGANPLFVGKAATVDNPVFEG